MDVIFSTSHSQTTLPKTSISFKPNSKNPWNQCNPWLAVPIHFTPLEILVKHKVVAPNVLFLTGFTRKFCITQYETKPQFLSNSILKNPRLSRPSEGRGQSVPDFSWSFLSAIRCPLYANFPSCLGVFVAKNRFFDFVQNGVCVLRIRCGSIFTGYKYLLLVLLFDLTRSFWRTKAGFSTFALVCGLLFFLVNLYLFVAYFNSCALITQVMSGDIISSLNSTSQ